MDRPCIGEDDGAFGDEIPVVDIVFTEHMRRSCKMCSVFFFFLISRTQKISQKVVVRE
jgi:hypothetical protein